MKPYTNEWQRRAALVDRNDPSAVAELRRDMERRMVHVVRRALDTGDGELAVQIRETADQFAMDETGPGDGELLIRRVTRWLCESLLQGARYAHPAFETVRV